MEEKMAYVFENYLVEFVQEDYKIVGEAFYPGEKTPVGKVTCHFYNYNNHEDTRHLKDDALHIDILRVQTKHDNKGIGTFLMKKVIEFAEKNKVKHVTTTPSPTGRITMDNLKRFYLKFKFSTGFLSRKIEFVDEDYLLADVLETENVENQDPVKRTVGDTAIPDRMNIDNAISTFMGFSSEKRQKTYKASKVAYLTVIHFLDDALQSKNDILQIGASGAGVYGTYLARKGHNVTVFEPNEIEVDSLRGSVSGIDRLSVVNSPYASLHEIESDSMDAVLCFGPMYSKLSMEEKVEVIRESYRICKSGGTVFISFLSNVMMVVENTFNSDFDFMIGPKFDQITLKTVSSQVRLLTFEEIETLFKLCEIKYTKRFAAEGIAMLLRDKIEEMNEKQFNRWVDYHYQVCMNEEMLGCSNQVIYVIKKS